MISTSFHLNIGTFKCTVISDGTIAVPGPLPPGFSGKPEDRPREIMDIGCLLVEQGRRKVLVDTGCGTYFQASAGKLLENCQKEGVNPASIETIVYTHLHPDHVGGTLDKEGKPVFVNARQVISKKEWDFMASATGQPARMFGLAQKNILPLRNQFDLLEENSEVMPGIKLVPAPGHTIGGVIIEISSGKDKLLCIGDLIHSFLEFDNPTHYSFLDSAPEEALKLRTEGLSKIAQSGVLVFACHFPFPGIGYIIKKDGILSWQPV
jgi:glyoxylase-like metal-dependent hydrolase (beta-lactamase superfamily II)